MLIFKAGAWEIELPSELAFWSTKVSYDIFFVFFSITRQEDQKLMEFTLFQLVSCQYMKQLKTMYIFSSMMVRRLENKKNLVDLPYNMS